MEGPADPFSYLGRVHRNEQGVVVSMEVFRPDDKHIKVAEGDEFVTFVTVVSLDAQR